MSTVTESALFKACVEDPKTMVNLFDLNLEEIAEPTDADQLSEKLFLQKKALKLYHMVWSGVTKYIRNVCMNRCTPIEFPGLGIFMPILPKQQETPENLNTKNLKKFENNELEF